MRRVGGLFNGTGAALYLCIGFVPDWVTVWNIEGTQILKAETNVNFMRLASSVEGIQFTAATNDVAVTAIGAGILPYYGGTVLNTTTAGTVTYGEGIFLKWDHNDYRHTSGNSPTGYGDASSVDIDTWTVDTPGSNTGHFNSGVAGTYIEEGSKIIIDGKQYAITAWTTDGSDDDEVTLSHSVASGEIQYIGGRYDFKPMVSGETTKDGFVISNATINVNGQLCCFEAGKYDN